MTFGLWLLAAFITFMIAMIGNSIDNVARELKQISYALRRANDIAEKK
tara:strand:- start:940 stop:1083 length:144 start_codon:yes stop_codon:yes gene_type:complete